MRRVGVLLLAGVAGLTLATPAAAGSYEVLACDAAPAGANNAWKAVGMPSAHYELGETCPAGNDANAGLAVRDLIGSPNAPDGSGVEWRFVAPANGVITGWRYSRRLGKDSDPDWDVYARLGDGTTLDTCTVNHEIPDCEVGAAPGTVEANERDASGFSTSSLHFGIRCAAGGLTCAPGGLTMHNAWAHLYSSTVTLTENVAPEIDAPTGTLLDGGWRRGEQTVAISASDDLGIRATRVYVDGDLIASATRTCDFTYTVPCTDPPCTAAAGMTCGDGAASATHTIDTADLADGERQVEVAAVDAAGNEARAAGVAVNVDNHPPAIAISGPIGQTTNASVPVAWSSDDGDGSGVAGHDVEVSVDEGAWQPWLAGTTTTSATYPGTPGRTYRFRGRATDASGLTSGWALSPAVHVVAEPQPPAGDQRGTTDAGGGVPPVPGGDESRSPTTEGAIDEPPPISRRTPALRVHAVRRRGTRLVVTGTVSRTATGRVTVTYAARIGRRLRRTRATATVRRGRFTVALRPFLRSRRGQVTVAYAGDDRFRPRTIRSNVGSR